MIAKLEALAKEAGFYQWGVLPTQQIEFSQEVRKMCEQNTCRQYGKTWCCPPAVGTVEECRERVCQYQWALVFSVKYQLEDSFDYEGMTEGMKAFKTAARKFSSLIKDCLSDYLILSNEGCDLCPSCTYPDAPCRFPQLSHGSLEAYGIFVTPLAKAANVVYNNGPCTVTYFGALFFNDEEQHVM